MNLFHPSTHSYSSYPSIQAAIQVTVVNQSPTNKEAYFIHIGEGICIENVPFVVHMATLQPGGTATHPFPERIGFTSNYFIGIKDEHNPDKIILSRSIQTSFIMNQAFRRLDDMVVVDHIRVPVMLFTGC